LVINENLISHHQKTKQKPICYMTKSLISDGLPINTHLLVPPPPFSPYLLNSPLPHHHLYAYHPTRHLPPYMLTYLPTSTHIILPTYIFTTSLLFDELFFMWILHPYLKIWIQSILLIIFFIFLLPTHFLKNLPT